MCYLQSVKVPYAYYYNCNDGEIDTDSFGQQYDNYKLGQDYLILIRKNSIMHLFFNGTDRVYFLNGVGDIRMYIEVNDTLEFYKKIYNWEKVKILSSQKIEKFMEYIKEFEE